MYSIDTCLLDRQSVGYIAVSFSIAILPHALHSLNAQNIGAVLTTPFLSVSKFLPPSCVSSNINLLLFGLSSVDAVEYDCAKRSFRSTGLRHIFNLMIALLIVDPARTKYSIPQILVCTTVWWYVLLYGGMYYCMVEYVSL